MPFSEFLALTKVLKMLFGGDTARMFFTKNVGTYYNLNSESLLKEERVKR